MTSVAPAAKGATSKPAQYQAEIKDFAALVKAVADGRAPISVLTIDWESLDALVKIHGAELNFDGVVLQQVAA